MRICIYVGDILSNLHLVTIPMFKWHTAKNIFNLIDVLSNLHLVTIPMFKWHIGENIFNLIVRFLDVLSDVMMIWHAKFMSVLTNGKNTMIGCHLGIMIRLKQATELPVMRIWCVLHQIDIVIKNATTLLQYG